MLFDSSIRKELARSFGATLVVLVTVVMTMMLIRTLGQAVRGNVSPSDVMLVMGFTVLGQLPTLLSLCLFVAIVSTLTRMYSDSEMVIWFASGRGVFNFLGPVLRFAWPILLAIALLALLVWPWANQQIETLKLQYEQRSDIDRIAPGEFQESANGSKVFFIDRDSTAGDVASNVFIAATDPKGEAITSARSAKMEVRDGERLVILTEGRRMEIAGGTAAAKPIIKISEFEEYGTRIGTATTDVNNIGPIKTISTQQLLIQATPVELGEVGWRLGLALSAFNFVLLALALASVNPRASRSGNLLLALFTFIVYYNLLTLGQSWVGSGRIGLLPFLALLHGSTLVLAGLLLTARHHHWSPRYWLRRGGSAA